MSDQFITCGWLVHKNITQKRWRDRGAAVVRLSQRECTERIKQFVIPYPGRVITDNHTTKCGLFQTFWIWAVRANVQPFRLKFRHDIARAIRSRVEFAMEYQKGAIP